MYLKSKLNHLIVMVAVALLGHGAALGSIDISLRFESAVQDALITGEIDKDGRFTSQPKFTFQPARPTHKWVAGGLPRFTSINPFRPEIPVAAYLQTIQCAVQANRAVSAENRGQWPEEVQYQVRLGGVNAWITKKGVLYDLYQVEGHDPSNGLTSRLASSPTSVRRAVGQARLNMLVGQANPEQERERLENTRHRGHLVEMSFEQGRVTISKRGLR